MQILYENERGLSVTLEPFIKNLFAVFQVLKVDERLPNDIFSVRESNWHGERDQGSLMGAREILIDGKIDWDPKQPNLIFGYKKSLTDVFNPDQTGRITYIRKGQKTIRFIDGVRLTELPVFTEGIGTLRFFISLKCNQPFWQQKTESIHLSFTQPNIFFPWSIRPTQYMGVVPTEPKTYFGLRRSTLEAPANNVGAVKTGFKAIFTAKGELKNPWIKNLETGDQLKIVGNPGDFTMQKDDIIEIISLPKDTRIIIGENTRGMRYLEEGSKFFLLPIGETMVAFGADYNSSLLDVRLVYEALSLGAESND